MKKLILILCILLSYSLYAQEKAPNNTIAKQLLEQVTRHLMNEEYKQLHQMLDERMAAMLTPEKMAKTFQSFSKQYGKIQKGLEFSEQVKAEQTFYRQGLQLEKEKMNLLITLNDEQKLSNFLLKPYTPIYSWSPPSYANLSSFTEENIKVGDSLALLGIYTQTKDASTSIVVFVHGSGPNDMDESLGPNKLFKDLAYGLASQGINSIRYNKRSFDYPSQMGKMMNISIDDIVVNDAVIAIQTAKDKGAKKVILVGHSLGGHMSAKIADQITVDGVIVLAGNVSPLEDLLVPQYEHILKNDPETSINEFHLNMIKNQVKRVQDKDYDEKTAAPMLPLSLPASFWLSLKDYKPAKVSKKQAQAYLILNGERDYQVTIEQA
ncbi:MAG: alpha/beta fold hydrolase [Flavobacteriales bacterium]|nr:alpha/beta fold hydrolase [Flavobacteriales bacterium]